MKVLRDANHAALAEARARGSHDWSPSASRDLNALTLRISGTPCLGSCGVRMSLRNLPDANLGSVQRPWGWRERASALKSSFDGKSRQSYLRAQTMRSSALEFKVGCVLLEPARAKERSILR